MGDGREKTTSHDVHKAITIKSVPPKSKILASKYDIPTKIDRGKKNKVLLITAFLFFGVFLLWLFL